MSNLPLPSDSEKSTCLSLNLQMGGTFPFHLVPRFCKCPYSGRFPGFFLLVGHHIRFVKPRRQPVVVQALGSRERAQLRSSLL